MLLVLIGLLDATSAGAVTYEIRPDGLGDFPTIQAAVDAASDGDVIELADGIYMGAGNREVTFAGKAITIRSENGPEACVLQTDHRRGFLFESGEGPMSVLDGVSVENAFDLGAGVLCRGPVAPTISNLILDGLYAYPVIASEDGASPTISDCVISNCNNGSIIRVDAASARFLDCHFSNGAGEVGPQYEFGVYNGGSLDVLRCTFESGHGLLRAAQASTTYFENCQILGATLDRLDERLVILQNTSSCTIENSLIGACSGTVGHALMGLEDSSAMELIRCTVAGNRLEAGGFLFDLEPGASLILDSSLVAYNVAPIFQCGTENAIAICSDAFSNRSDDGEDCPPLGADSFSDDPLFCDLEGGDYSLAANSPCLPENSPCGSLVGVPMTPCDAVAFGACCSADGNCHISAGVLPCQNANGSFLGLGSACDPEPCPAGACCSGEQCQIVDSSVGCEAIGGTYAGDGSVCYPTVCTEGSWWGEPVVTVLPYGVSNHVVGRIDEDLLDDVAFRCDGQVGIGIANGTGGFEVSFTGAPAVGPVSIGDVNGDGSRDIIVQSDEGEISVHENQEGAWVIQTVLGPNRMLMGAADLDGDGRSDVLAVPFWAGYEQVLSVYWGEPDGTDPDPTNIAFGEWFQTYEFGQYELRTVDFTLNGEVDVLLGYRSADEYSHEAWLALIPNLGNRAFESPTLLVEWADALPFRFGVGDVDGDEDADVVFTRTENPRTVLYRNDGEGGLVPGPLLIDSAFGKRLYFLEADGTEGPELVSGNFAWDGVDGSFLLHGELSTHVFDTQPAELDGVPGSDLLAAKGERLYSFLQESPTAGVPEEVPVSDAPLSIFPTVLTPGVACRIEVGGPSTPNRELIVVDPNGRVVCRLGSESGSYEWSGRNEYGRLLPAGVYWIRDSVSSASGRVTLLR